MQKEGKLALPAEGEIMDVYVYAYCKTDGIEHISTIYIQTLRISFGKLQRYIRLMNRRDLM